MSDAREVHIQSEREVPFQPASETSYLTNRGFVGYLKITDSYGSEVRVQESSAAFERAVWIFCDSPAKDMSPHLNVEQAKRVRDALDDFIKDAES